MRRYVLTREVRIDGRDFWGRRAFVILQPTGTAGWFWRVNGEDIALHPTLVHHANRRLVLRHGDAQMHVFEHFGALRFTGIDGIRFFGSSWLPYDGRAAMFWRELQPAIHPDGELKPMRNEMHVGVGEKEPIKRHLSGEIGVGDDFMISVDVGYPEWGELRRTHRIPEDGLDEIFLSKSLGRPPWLRTIARAVHWPHLNNVLWPQGRKPEQILRELALHGILDILGAVSAIAPAGEYLTGTLSGSRASHLLATRLLRKVERKL